MNSDSHSKDLSPAQDRLTEALLEEHSRLGTGSDEDLVAKILLQTVDAPSNVTPITMAPKQRFGWKDWSKVAAAVIGIVSLVAFGLNQMSSGPAVAKNGERQEETFHLVVKYVETPRGEAITPAENRKILVSAHPGEKKFSPVTVGNSGGVPAFDLDALDLSPPTTDFGQSIKSLPPVSIVSSTFKLASNETTTSGSKVIYSGDVELSHSDFILQADSLVIDRSGYAGDVPLLKALNGVLTHRTGVYETEADSISFDPSNGELIARGIQRLLSRGEEQVIVNRAAMVVFENDGFFIQEAF
ncbi:MAG: hypothetical protein P1U89_22955 [Verrucomicrobiales bacterium]|nr:hypothetical protein [Verrucomicrobiales bacterium]